MNPAAIIREAQADGVALALSPAGTIKAIGDASAVNRWLPILKEYKPGLLTALQEAVHEVPIPDDLENLIRRAGTFWEYSPEDYDLVRDLARRDPEGLRRALESDKWLMAAERDACDTSAGVKENDGRPRLSRAEEGVVEIQGKVGRA